MSNEARYLMIELSVLLKTLTMAGAIKALSKRHGISESTLRTMYLNADDHREAV
jgi:hypothetical protein